MLDALMTRILSGDLSTKATSFLLVLPSGCTGAPIITPALVAHYKTEAHPDLMTLTAPKVDEIRECQSFLHAKSLTDMKTLWVAKADLLNTQAANAFLKSLEEPASKTRIILTTDRPQTLLPTILSRCIKLSAAHDKHLMAKELELAGVEKSAMAESLALCGHDVQTAAKLATIKGALPWAKSINAWLTGKGKRPGPPPMGKEGLDPRACGLVFSTALMPLAKSGDMKILEAIDTWLAQNTDLDRPGIDMKTRLWAWYALFS